MPDEEGSVQATRVPPELNQTGIRLQPLASALTSSEPLSERFRGCTAVSTMSQSGIEPSGYDFVPLREGGEFTLYRGWQGGPPSPILVVAPAAEHQSPQSLRRLEHEYSLATEVDPLWAAKPHRAGHLVRVLSRQYSAIKILAKVIDDSAARPSLLDSPAAPGGKCV
jgi:hypothetical protein